jgi:tetrapyrrole methylase family protein/MazG family protein
MTFEDFEQALAGLGREFDSLQIVAAAAAAQQHYPVLDPGQPILLHGLQDVAIAERLRDVLNAAFPPEWEVTGLDGGVRCTVKLADLPSAVRPGRSVSVFIPPLPTASSFPALQDLIARLRAPDGCPWDRALTWAKLRATLLEETHELLAALDADDAGKVAEEQGDLLVQIAMQAQIACEEGRFRMPEVIRLIVDKLTRRHPHVFGEAVVTGTDEVLANWEAIKLAERERNGAARSPLAGVPPGLPALAQADAYLDRMSRLGGAVDAEAPWGRLADLGPDDVLTAELFGEALFELVAWGRKRGVDAESALREVNAQFAARVAARVAARAAADEVPK